MDIPLKMQDMGSSVRLSSGTPPPGTTNSFSGQCKGQCRHTATTAIRMLSALTDRTGVPSRSAAGVGGWGGDGRMNGRPPRRTGPHGISRAPRAAGATPTCAAASMVGGMATKPEGWAETRRSVAGVGSHRGATSLATGVNWEQIVCVGRRWLEGRKAIGLDAPSEPKTCCRLERLRRPRYCSKRSPRASCWRWRRAAKPALFRSRSGAHTSLLPLPLSLGSPWCVSSRKQMSLISRLNLPFLPNRMIHI